MKSKEKIQEQIKYFLDKQSDHAHLYLKAKAENNNEFIVEYEKSMRYYKGMVIALKWVIDEIEL